MTTSVTLADIATRIDMLEIMGADIVRYMLSAPPSMINSVPVT